MSATVIINRLTGAGPSKTNITSANTRVNAADVAYTNETTNPIAIPGSGSNYSFWCVTRLECTVAPATLVNNLKWFTDGTNSFGTGVTCLGETATGYVQASGTVGTTGIQLTTGNYGTLAGSPSNVFSFTAGSPLAVAGSTSGTGDFGDYVVYQFAVGSTASPGASGQETFTWQYDET